MQFTKPEPEEYLRLAKESGQVFVIEKFRAKGKHCYKLATPNGLIEVQGLKNVIIYMELNKDEYEKTLLSI